MSEECRRTAQELADIMERELGLVEVGDIRINQFDPPKRKR
jgi:hypothetical protein